MVYIVRILTVSQFKKMLGEDTEVQQIVSYICLKLMNGKQYQKEVFGYKKNALGVSEVLISWKGLPWHEAT